MVDALIGMIRIVLKNQTERWKYTLCTGGREQIERKKAQPAHSCLQWTENATNPAHFGQLSATTMTEVGQTSVPCVLLHCLLLRIDKGALRMPNATGR